MPPSEPSLHNWLLGLLASGVVAVVGLYFRGILGELRAVTSNLSEVVKSLTAQDKTLALTVQRVDAHDVEIERLREAQALQLRQGLSK